MLKTNQVQFKGAQVAYGRSLRQVAEHVGHLVRGFPIGQPSSAQYVAEVLQKYADTLTPWARATAEKMLQAIARKDKQAWMLLSAKMSRALRDEIQNAPTGEIFQRILNEQVSLIRSLPLEAAARVQELTLKGFEQSIRPEQIAKEIMRTGEVTKSRANTIARTETSRTAAALTQARAEYIGSTHLVWRSSKDASVRRGHKLVDGKIFEWRHPPLLIDGVRALPGQEPNCRCWAEAIIPG